MTRHQSLSLTALSASLFALCGGCMPSAEEGALVTDDVGPTVAAQWPAPSDACWTGVPEPSRLLLTTTDFSTGAMTVVDADTLEVTADVALGSTDAIPFYDPVGERVVVVHRFGLDYLDVWTPDGFTSRGQFPIANTAGSSNLQAAAFDPDGLAWVTSLGSPWVHRLDLDRSPADAVVDAVDLSAFADADRNPEASVIVACGAQIYVGVQRLDASFTPTDVDMLVAIDHTTQLPIDLDPQQPGGQGLELAGTWLRQLRVDPADPTGRTLLALTSGIERIDTVTGTTTWAVPEARFAEAGIDAFRLPQSFAISADGRTAYIAAYVGDFSQVQLMRVGLDDKAPQTPQPFADGLDSVERTLERVGTQLWYGSTRSGSPGLWVYDLESDPPSPVAGPLPTGLAPYSMVGLP